MTRPRYPHLPRQPRWLRFLPAGGGALALAAATPCALAAEVTLTATNGFGTSSFESALSWSDGLAPALGNDYVVPAGLTLRTPAGSATDHFFAGDSLRITGGTFIYKGITNVNTVTIPGLTLDGSLVNNASDSSTPFILAGDITIGGTGTSTLFSNNATITVPAAISGSSGTLLLQTNNTLGRQVVLAGDNTFTGDINVTGASGAVLSSTGVLTFKVGATGVNNRVTGSSPFTFEGGFRIDLAGAGDTVGDSWQLVDATALAETYGALFYVEGFMENGTFWTSPDGRYQFDEATGALKRIQGDGDGDGLPDAWEDTYLGTRDQTGADDPDGDFCSNLLEYQSGTLPRDATSFPDIDDDGLNDGWELNFFLDLDETATGDPDNDYNTNLEEYLALSDPTSRFFYPDTDGDGLNDGWERHFFPALPLSGVLPGDDPDGDLATNEDEMYADTDPTDADSSPDSDFDNLPDGWEVKYFREGSQDLAAVIARYSGSDDPDGDGFTNLSEYVAGTDPTDATSFKADLAFWRFEEATTGEVPGDEGGGAFTAVVLDSTGSGNAMRTWNGMTAPAYATDVPAATVPATGAANTASLYFDAGTDGTWGDLTWTDTAAPLRRTQLTAWTIEASFKLDPTLNGTANQAVMSKDGNPVGGQPPFHLKYLGATQKLEVGLLDGAGTVKYLIGTRSIAPGEWYSAAVTADATTLSLWLKGPGDAAYVLEGTLAIEGAFYNTSPGFDDAWAVGRARWNGGETDWFKGWIDEVRVSAMVLPVTAFLFHEESTGTPYDAWAATAISDPEKRGAADDADGDGTTNLVEFRLGLDPEDGSAFFAARLSGSTLTWPAAAGIAFTIERSTTLGGWDTVGTVTATDAAGTWTDPAPPEGAAFYRVTFAE